MADTVFRWLSDDEFVVAIDRDVTPSALLRASAVEPGRYGSELAERMIACVFGGLVDLRREYDVYFAKEYESFDRFLYWKYGLNEEDLAVVAKAIKSEQLIGQGNIGCGGDYVLEYWMNHAGGKRLLKRVFRCAGDEYEDEE